MESVQSLTDELSLLRRENVALTRENIVSLQFTFYDHCYKKIKSLFL